MQGSSRCQSKPGTVSYSSFGIGSMAQLNLKRSTRDGTDMLHVPLQGHAGAQAAVAGEVGVTIAAVPAVQGFIKDGRLRALAVGSEKRFAVLPDVPTMTEAGASNDILIPTYFALLAPANTPAPIVAKLSTELKKALADPAVAERLAGAGLVRWAARRKLVATASRRTPRCGLAKQFAAVRKANYCVGGSREAMQFHLNGFKPGNPELSEAAERGTEPPDALPDEVDVLIVGCGPAGLTLAAQLAAFPDIKTRIVEQKSGPLLLGQADGIACRTMEMFEAFGFSERVLK